MLGHAKFFREKVYAEGKAEGKAEGRAEGKAEGRRELFNELLEARRKGIPLEEVLETYTDENDNKTNDTDTTTDT